MPQARRPRPGRNGNIPVGDIDEAEAASIRASVQRREQAPSSRQQTFVDWRKLADQLGQPFEIERIPISKLRSMRRDPMLAFGMAFMQTPITRMDWFIDAQDNNGPNPQVAGNVHYALSRIFVELVEQFFLSLVFGSVALAKRFEERLPAGVYYETAEDGTKTAQPLWSEGSIKPILWKPFVALPPETVEPNWNSDGEFDGINYKPPQGSGAPAGTGAKSNSGEGYDIPLSHSLWITNERAASFGNMYGYSRLAYAYRYWWSYWFRWAIADRAFEKKGDPSIMVKYPDGQSYDPVTQQQRENADIAMELGERIRSGGVVVMPSEVWMGEISGAPSAAPQWDISSLKEMLDFDPFDASFEYLDIMKLRSLWVPEQAFLEGKGGTSSRNVASTMGDAFVEQQGILADSLVEHINRWVIPQFLAMNFPEFIAAGGTARMVKKGFGSRDVEAMKTIVQLIGQQARGARELASVVDIAETAEALGMPVRPVTEQERVRREMEAEDAAAAAPSTPGPVGGSGLGVVPTATGFAYADGFKRERMAIFSDTANAFVRSLPDTPHYSDPAIRTQARELWAIWRSAYRDDYDSFAEYLEELGAEFAEPGDSHWERAKAIVERWTAERRPNFLPILDKTHDILKTMFSRAATIARREAGTTVLLGDEQIEGWVGERITDTTALAFGTTEEELTRFVANKLEEGVESPAELATQIRAHFAEFPDWKADRLARMETRDSYNAGVLLTSVAGGNQVQALDARAESGRTDAECRERDGEIFDPIEALKETDHPNGTLGWRAVPVEFSVQVEEPDPNVPAARYDPDTHTVHFAEVVPEEQRREFLKEVVATL